MLRRILGSEPKTSPAHLLFLSKFLRPQVLGNHADYWESALKETPERAVEKFLNDGLLEQVGLSERVSYKYKVSDLKPMLKQRGMKVTGRKQDLIDRLIEADPEGMQEAVRGLRIVQCTEQGRRIAQDYLAREARRRSDVEDRTLRAIRKGQFKEASEMVAAFEAEQVFSRGIGIDWKNHNSARDVERLRSISQARPQILSPVEEEQLSQLRLAAAMMYLWGTSAAKGWIPSDLNTGLDFDNDTAARMVLFFASNQQNLARLRKSQVKTVAILAAADSCPACELLAKSRFPIGQVPEIPYKECTYDLGCRCRVVLGDS